MIIILDSTGEEIERVEDVSVEPVVDLRWQALSLSLDTHSLTNPDED